jgi:hypothetical protein
MSKLQVDDIVNKDDTGSVGFSRGAVVTGVATATTFSGALTGNVTGNVQGDVTGDVAGDVTGNVTGNINSASASGISTVGILTAYSSVTIGSTNVLTAIDGKTSPGKAIALSMVFG